MDNRSNIIEKAEKAIIVLPQTSIEAAVVDFSETLNSIEKQRNAYLEYTLTVDSEIISSGTVLFVKAKHFGFIKPRT